MITPYRFCVVFAAAAALSAPCALQAQSSAPVWSKPDTFWYVRVLPSGPMWIKVDALHGVREPLFDHQRLATELTLRTGVVYTAASLPFADSAAQFVVKYDGSNAYIQSGALAVEFVLDGYHWRCELQIKWDWNKVPPTDYECARRGQWVAGVSAPLRRAPAPARVSPDGLWEAAVEQNNVAVRRAGSGAAWVALTADGTADFPYEPESIHWGADSSSLSAYRVSREVTASPAFTGSVRGLVVKGEWPVPR